MRILFGTLLATGLWAQTADPVREAVGRLSLDQYKAHIKGLAQFGDREQGTDRNRAAIDWLERELHSYGYTNIVRMPVMGPDGPLENVYATKLGSVTPGEMYVVSAHMDGRGGGEAADDDASGCSVVLELARVLAGAGVGTDRSVRFVFWNNEEFGMNGSSTYARQRSGMQGQTGEPKWLGLIQHDMMMYDHGMPPGDRQSPKADINVDFAGGSVKAEASAKLAEALRAANRKYATEYPVTVGDQMAGTDSIMFQDLVASVSVRENERLTGIVLGSNPNHHQVTDKYDNYREEDFRFGFTAAKTTLGALGTLAGIRVTR